MTVDLPYCSNNNNGKPIRYNNICEQNPRTKIKFNFEKNKTAALGYWSIFSKITHEDSGLGFECSKSKTDWTFYRTIFGDYYKSSGTTFMHLDRKECMNMRKTKICTIKENGKALKMTCNGDTCSRDEKVEEPWLLKSWWCLV